MWMRQAEAQAQNVIPHLKVQDGMEMLERMDEWRQTMQEVIVQTQGRDDHSLDYRLGIEGTAAWETYLQIKC